MPSPVRILDGGLGTALEDKYGVRFSSAATPLWSSHLLLSEDGRTTLRACQGDFVRAGADVVETATYQASAAGFACSGVAEPAIPDAVAHAVEHAVDIASGLGTTVALSIGPYGASMVPSTEYSGAYDDGGRDTDTLQAFHAQRLAWFAAVPRIAERVSLVAYETVPRRDEIAAIRKMYQGTTPDSPDNAVPAALAHTPYWIACVFPGDDEQGEAVLPDGSSVEDAVAAMLAPAASHSSNADRDTRPWGIGINCTKMHRLARLVARYEAAVAALVAHGHLENWPALVLYPDGTNGEVYNTTTQTWEQPAGVADAGASWETQLGGIVHETAAKGLWSEILVGGCCKATDRDIGALKAVVASA